MAKLCIPSRYGVCFALWLSIACLYILRSNMSVAILSMAKPVNNKTSSTYTSCKRPTKPTTNPQIQPSRQFDWDESTQFQILSGFFQGYASTHLIGSIVSASIGPRISLTICLVGTSIFAFLTPLFARLSPYALIAARVLGGIFSGALYPIAQEVLGVWTPITERTFLAGITHSGNIFGLVSNYAIGAYMCGENGGPFGWENFFYFSGAMGAFACIVWLVFGYDKPSKHPCISSSELSYLKNYSNDGNESSKVPKIPYKQIFLSPAVIAVTCAHFAHLIIFYALITGHAKFLKDVFEYSTRDASLISMIPFITNFVVQLIYPLFVDYLRNKRNVNVSFLRRISSGIAFTGGAIFLFFVGYLGCSHRNLVVLFMSIALGFIGLNTSGYLTAAIDIAPQYAGIVMGVMNTFGSIAGFVGPQIAARFLAKGDRLIGWRNTFIVEAVLSFVIGFVFVTFGSSELQSWAQETQYHALGSEAEPEATAEPELLRADV